VCFSMLVIQRYQSFDEKTVGVLLFFFFFFLSRFSSFLFLALVACGAPEFH
jgi:hypothetical protein